MLVPLLFTYKTTDTLSVKSNDIAVDIVNVEEYEVGLLFGEAFTSGLIPLVPNNVEVPTLFTLYNSKK